MFCPYNVNKFSDNRDLELLIIRFATAKNTPYGKYFFLDFF